MRDRPVEHILVAALSPLLGGAPHPVQDAPSRLPLVRHPSCRTALLGEDEHAADLALAVPRPGRRAIRAQDTLLPGLAARPHIHIRPLMPGGLVHEVVQTHRTAHR